MSTATASTNKTRRQAALRGARSAFANYDREVARAKKARRRALTAAAKILTLEEIGDQAKPPLSKGRVSQIISEEPS